MAPQSQEGGSAGSPEHPENDRPVIKAVTEPVTLPIEGYTPWPQIMRLVAIASFVLVMLLACTLFLLVPEDDLDIRLDDLMLGLAVFLIFEMVVMRCLIIPMNGDYGRFRIGADRVDFYPLSTMGFGVQSRMQSVPIGDFSGIAVRMLERREGATSRYAVVILHEKRANMIHIRYAPTRVEAEDYARILAASLNLPVIAAFP